MIKSTCQRCNRIFLYTQYDRDGKFCSKACFKNPRIEETCLQCRKKFLYMAMPTRLTRKYCSHECYHESQYKSLKDIFETFVIKNENSCWEWMGTLFPNGYALINYKKKKLLAHKVSYELHIGEIPEGMLVTHTCDFRRCTAPTHLVLGTHKDNNQDMIKKGRAFWQNKTWKHVTLEES